jgi:hypothetical protein
MPRQQARPNRAPYTQVLSALRKMDLVRLCIEFRLSPEGSVVDLKTRLKDYITLNREIINRNPRYTALFPRHNRPIPPPSPPSSPPHTTPPSSPALSYRTVSPALSDESWHGIAGPADDHAGVPAEHQHDNSPEPHHHQPHVQPDQPHGHFHPPVQQYHHHYPDYPENGQNPQEFILPPPSPPPAVSNRGSLPPAAHNAIGREYLHPTSLRDYSSTYLLILPIHGYIIPHTPFSYGHYEVPPL